jgi:hypothetical protein
MRIAALGFVVIALGSTACVSPSDPWERERALELTQKSYLEALRWGNLEKAARYVDPEQREEFLALAPSFETIRITDYDIGELDLDEDSLAHAECDVTYRGYVMPHYIEKRVRDHQVWYRDEENDNEWRVRPQLAAMLDGLGVRP